MDSERPQDRPRTTVFSNIIPKDHDSRLFQGLLASPEDVMRRLRASKIRRDNEQAREQRRRRSLGQVRMGDLAGLTNDTDLGLPQSQSETALTTQDYRSLLPAQMPRKHVPNCLRPRDGCECPPMSHHDYIRWVFSQAFAHSDYTLDDLLPWRIKTAWRLVRELARHKGMIHPDETLAQGLAMDMGDTDQPDPWRAPSSYQPPPGKAKDYSPLVIDYLQAADFLPNEHVVSVLIPSQGTWMPTRGMSLLPPDVPAYFTNSLHEPAETYDPKDDQGLNLYIEIIEALSHRLLIERGTVAEPQAGRFGMFGLTNPYTIRVAFPSRLQIIAWEMMLIGETLELLVNQSSFSVRRTLEDKYGLTPDEITMLVRLARFEAKARTSADLEEDRGLMVMRLENLAERSRESLDWRSELGALKQIAIVQGLGKADPNDLLKDFVDVVKAVSSARKIEQIEPAQLPALTEANAR